MKVYSLTKITTKINGEKRLTYIEARDLSKNAYEKYWESPMQREVKSETPSTQPFPKPVTSNAESMSTDKISDKQLQEWLKTTDGKNFLESLQDGVKEPNIKETPQEDEYTGEVVEDKESDSSFWSIMILIVACGLCIFLSSLG